MYLLDTNIVSELRRPRPHGVVLAWLDAQADRDLFLCAVTIAEIQAGIEITREQDARKATEIERWLDQVAETFNVLSADTPVLRQWAKFMHRQQDHLIEDALIAATAYVHGLTVATPNIADFQLFGIALVNPFEN